MCINNFPHHNPQHVENYNPQIHNYSYPPMLEIKKNKELSTIFLWKICGKLYKNNVFFCFYPQNAVDKYIFY